MKDRLIFFKKLYNYSQNAKLLLSNHYFERKFRYCFCSYIYPRSTWQKHKKQQKMQRTKKTRKKEICFISVRNALSGLERHHYQAKLLEWL